MLRTEDVEGWVTVMGVRQGTCVKQHNCHADHPWRRTGCCLDQGRPPTPRRVRKVTQELRRKDLTRQSVGAEERGEEEGREDCEEGTACVRALRQK